MCVCVDINMCIYIYIKKFSCGSSPFCALRRNVWSRDATMKRRHWLHFTHLGFRIIHSTFPRVSRTKIPMAFPTSPGFGSGPAYENRWKSAMAFSETVPLEHTIKPKKNLGTATENPWRFSRHGVDHGKPNVVPCGFFGVYPWLYNQGSQQWITGLCGWTWGMGTQRVTMTSWDKLGAPCQTNSYESPIANLKNT